MSLEEWLALDEDDSGELVDGFYEESEMPGLLHETTVVFLVVMFHTWGQPRGARVVGSGLKYVLRPRHGRMPDVSVFLPDAPLPAGEGGVYAPPSIAIEIVSPTPRDQRRDRVDKMSEYAAFGVPWYWLVDPALRSIEVFELIEGGRYVRALAATEGQVEVPACEGLVLDVDALWRELDALTPRPEASDKPAEPDSE
ncbi:MAG: Uma2 family endonuclease [Deltaproteobacteria bacterium]|nr:Uma2 family endonuclease [Deltaproteobacteria bacterium]